MTTQPHSPDARLQALNALLQVLPGSKAPKSLNQLCRDETNDGKMPPFAQMLVYGVCRYYQPLTALITARLSKPLKAKDRDITIILLLGAYQLLYTNKPAHAIVNHTTELARKRRKKWAAGLVNGVLRGLERDLSEDCAQKHSPHKPGEKQTQKLPQITPESAFPAWIKEAIASHYSVEQTQQIFEQSLIPAPMSVRHNPLHQSTTAFEAELSEKGLTGKWSERTPGCFTFSSPCAVSDIPDFFEGSCSVQDEAAQWATRLLDPSPNSRVLDACAAPGGKTGHLLEWASGIHVTALDVNQQRLEAVQQNLDRLKKTAKLIAADAAATDHWWDGEAFDHILLDAPCSGSGVLRRHPDIFWLKDSKDITQLVELQKQLLQKLWETLKPGGTLLYCTCSLFPEENALQIADFLGDYTDARLINLDNTPLAISSKVTFSTPKLNLGVQILPTRADHDGFFYALISKENTL
jgi:16S rRNA (cytosine967-C5)-methyltransferase